MAEFFTIQPEMDLWPTTEYDLAAFVQPVENPWNVDPFGNIPQFENWDTWFTEPPTVPIEQGRPTPPAVAQAPQPTLPPPLPPAPESYVQAAPQRQVSSVTTWRTHRRDGIHQRADMPTRPKAKRALPAVTGTPMTPEMRLRERVGMLHLHLNNHSASTTSKALRAVETLQLIHRMRFEEIRHHAATVRFTAADPVDIRDVIYLLAANCQDKAEITTFIDAAIKLIKQMTGME